MSEVLLTNNFEYLNSDEYSKFDKFMYRKIASCSYRRIGRYLQMKYIKQNYNTEFEDIDCYKYDCNTMNLEHMCIADSKKNFVLGIILTDTNYLIDMAEYSKMNTNISECNTRYYPLCCVIKISSQKAGHAVMCIFDKYTTKAYMIDSNGDFIDYFADEFPEPELSRFHFHNAFSELFKTFGYTYVSSLESKMMKVINKNNFLENEKTFFRGYCMAWSIFFCELFLMEHNQSKEVNEILDIVFKQDSSELNELINRYQSYLYSNIKHNF